MPHSCVVLVRTCANSPLSALKGSHTLATKANLSGYRPKLGQSRCLCLYGLCVCLGQKMGQPVQCNVCRQSEGSKSQPRDQVTRTEENADFTLSLLTS